MKWWKPFFFQLISCVWLFVTPWTAASQTPVSSTISWSLLKFMSIELVIFSNHLIVYCPILLCLHFFPASGSFPVSQLFTSGGLSIEAPASASVLPRNIHRWFPLGWTGLIFSLSKGISKVFSDTTVWNHQFFDIQPSLWSNSYVCTWLPEKP